MWTDCLKVNIKKKSKNSVNQRLMEKSLKAVRTKTLRTPSVTNAMTCFNILLMMLNAVIGTEEE